MTVDTSPIHDALIGLQMAVLAVDAHDDGESWEWQSIRDAWEQVRARLAVTDNLSAVVHPSEQRHLTDLLEELTELYHLINGQPIVGPVPDRIEQKIKKLIRTFAPATATDRALPRPKPRTIVRPPRKTADRKPATVNECMAAMLLKDPSLLSMSASKWAVELECSSTAVKTTNTWKSAIRNARMMEGVKKMTNSAK